MPVFGIDLGTTFSAIAWVDEMGKAQIITNFEGDNTTPSVIFFDDRHKPSIGKVAQNQAQIDPKSYLRLIKRCMGDELPLFVRDGKEYRAEFLSALILGKLKKDAEMKLNQTVTDVMVSVPAYFQDAQRKATRNAAQIAGLNVLGIINEPTAAALAYGLNKRHEDQTVLIYDLGGGTFDVSIIRIEQQQIRELATDGDMFLGGTDFDDAVKCWLGTEFLYAHGAEEKVQNWLQQHSDQTDLKPIFEQAMAAWQPYAGPCLGERIQANETGLAAQVKAYFERKDSQTLIGALFSDALIDFTVSQNIEQNKRTLSVKDSVPLTVQMPGQIMYRKELSLAVFDLLTEDLIQSTIAKVESVLHKAGLKREELDKILLVGGATCMQAVPKAVTQFLGKSPNRDIEPNQCVAQGAAYAAQIKKAETSPSQPTENAPNQPRFSSVMAHGLGVAVVHPEDRKKEKAERRLLNALLIQPNTPLPAQAAKHFGVASADARRLQIQVLQGEQGMPAEDCQLIGNLSSLSIPPRTTDQPSIRVEVAYDLDGIVQIRVVDEESGRSISDHLQAQSGLSEKELKDGIHDFNAFLPDL